MKIDPIRAAARTYGLFVRGSFSADPEDRVPPVDQHADAHSLILFGNAGSSIWQAFSQSKEYKDGNPDPLNRWSRRIGENLAGRFKGRALFPFGGPPYQPFLKWAKKAEGLENSMLGMLIHPEYGLWHAYRFAIALPVEIDLPAAVESPTGICRRCSTRPCLGSCPVNAFTENSYDVKSCYQYLQSNPESSCMRMGCQARAACPNGETHRYQPVHANFHMGAFVRSMAEQQDRFG